MDLLKCRVCGRGEVKSLGQIPDCGEFAGQQISPPIKGGELWLCKVCGSMFRHPTLSTNDYISLYEKAPGTVWVDGEIERNDFTTIYAYLKNHVGGSLLDIGCYTGNFLADLPDKFKKYGLEPSNLASEIATSKGVEVIGKTFDSMDAGRLFDVVVSIDVVEHVLDVENFLNQALAHVKENGLLIISTGNPGNFFWKKVFKCRFWYNFFAEHLTFPSYSYYVDFTKRHGLQLPEQIRFRYIKLSLIKRLSILLRFSLSLVIYKAMKKIRGVATDKILLLTHVSFVGVFTDHHVVIFRKKRL